MAPMSGLILGLTVLILPLPLFFVVLGIERLFLLGVAAFLLLIWGFVWGYMRPAACEVDANGLTVRWLLRRWSVPRADIESVELLEGSEFRARYGWGMRVGAGGLWGAFGLLVTRKGTFRFYISRLDSFVLVQSRGGRPLLITPSDPEAFVAALSDPL